MTEPYELQWFYPGQWFDEMGSFVLTMGENGQMGIDISRRSDINRSDRADMGRAITDSGIPGYE